MRMSLEKQFKVLKIIHSKPEFVNFFALPQWIGIKEDLKKLKKRVESLISENGDLEKFCVDEVCAFSEKDSFLESLEKSEDKVKAILDYELRRECMYHFWCKFEHEVIVTGVLDEAEDGVKIDVFQQLEANWSLFSEIALSEIL